MSRKTLDTNIGFEDIFGRIAFTSIALGLAADDGDKEVAALAPPINKLLTRWTGLDSDRRDQRLAEVRVNALCKRRNVQIDAEITSTHNATLAFVEQDRQSPLFTHLFPKPLSTLTKPAVEAQVKIGQAFVDRLVKSEAPASLRKAHEQPLRDSIERGDAAVKERGTLVATAAQQSTQVEALRTDANAALLFVEGALKQLAAKRRESKEWVDSFFPDVSSRKKKPAAPPTPTP